MATVPAYSWVKCGTNGGGRVNCSASDPLTAGHVIASGDVFGQHWTQNFGDNWWACQSGLQPKQGSVNTLLEGRAAAVSQRPATSGLAYWGMGPEKTYPGPGYFGCTPNGSYNLIMIDGGNDFGSAFTFRTGANWPRGTGNLIVCDYGGYANDAEYIYTLNLTGLTRYENSSVRNIVGSQSGTGLGMTGLFNAAGKGAYPKSMCLIDSSHMLACGYSYDPAGARVQSKLYMITPVSGTLHSCSAVNATDITSHVPSAATHLNWIEYNSAIDSSHVYVCADNDVYQVSTDGTTTWTALNTPSNFPTAGGNPAVVRIRDANTLYVFCGQDPTANGQVVMKGVNSSGWKWAWISPHSSYNSTEFPTAAGNTYFLSNGSAPHDMTTMGFGCNSGELVVANGHDYLFAFGFDAVFSTRNAEVVDPTVGSPTMPTWRACSNGFGGGENVGGKAGSGGAITIWDNDFHAFSSNDHGSSFAEASFSQFSTSGLTASKSVGTNTWNFAVNVGSKPASATLNGTAVDTDPYFGGACLCVNSVDLSAESPPTLYVFLNGGELLRGTPVTTPVPPTAGTPSLTSDSPVQGTAVSVNANISSWGGNPTPTVQSYQWYTAPNASGTFTKITGAITASYTPVAGDVGNVLKCLVKVGNVAGTAQAYTETSGAVSSSGHGTTPPSTPTGLAASNVFYNEVDLSWTASTAGSNPIKDYGVFQLLNTGTPIPVSVSNGSANVTGASALIAAGLVAGMSVFGADIPAGTIVNSVNAGAGTFVMSAQATGTNAGEMALAGQSVGTTATASTVTFNVTGLTQLTTYAFTVVCFDTTGLASGNATTLTETTPMKPNGGDQQVVITNPADGQQMTNQTPQVRATVTPGTYPITSVVVTVNTNPAVAMSPSATVTDGWQKTVSLADGENTITVTATDSTNAAVFETITVSFGNTNQAPTYTFLNPSAVDQVVTTQQITAQIDWEDADGIDESSVFVSTDGGVTWLPMTFNPPASSSGTTGP